MGTGWNADLDAIAAEQQLFVELAGDVVDGLLTAEDAGDG